MGKKPDVDWNKFIDESIEAEKAAADGARGLRPSMVERYIVGPLRRGAATIVVAVACVIVVYGSYKFVASRLKPTAPEVSQNLAPTAGPEEIERDQPQRRPEMQTIPLDLPPSDFPSEQQPKTNRIETQDSKLVKRSVNQIVMPTQLNPPGAHQQSGNNKRQTSPTPRTAKPGSTSPASTMQTFDEEPTHAPPGPRENYTWIRGTIDKNGVRRKGHWRKK